MKPILFNTEMVKAILDGRKTVTRRLVKIPRYVELEEDGTYTLYAEGTAYGKQCMEQLVPYLRKPCDQGDILYVREATFGVSNGTDNQDLCYRTCCHCGLSDKEHSKVKGWHPSIHMPKEAARIFLKVTDVRVERLQDITEEHAIKEGTPYELCGGWKPTFYDPDSGGPDPDFIDGFSKLWNSTVDMKNHWMDQSWGANPWVWVIEFERIEKPIEN